MPLQNQACRVHVAIHARPVGTPKKKDTDMVVGCHRGRLKTYVTFSSEENASVFYGMFECCKELSAVATF